MYIYDVIFNFHKYYYNYYEWRMNDRISNYKKVRVFRVNSYVIDKIINGDVWIDKKFMEIFKGNVCILSDRNRSIGVMFDKSGRIVGKSGMVYDEEDEVLDLIEDKMEVYIKIVRSVKRRREDRVVYEIKRDINIFLKSIRDEFLWKYLYYSMYKEECEDIEMVKNNINRLGRECNLELYDIIKNINIKKTTV